MLHELFITHCTNGKSTMNPFKFIKVESEQQLTITSARRIAFFQAGLKLVSPVAVVKLSNIDNRCSTFDGSNNLHLGGWCK